MPLPTRPVDHAAESARLYLIDLFERAGGMRDRPRRLRNVARLIRHEIGHARDVLSGPNVDLHRVVRRVEIELERNPDRLLRTSGRLEFAEVWLALGADAVAAIEREDAWAARYAALPDHEDDRVFASASAASAAERWD